MIDHVPTDAECRPHDPRAFTRWSLSLSAVLYCEGLPASVRVRNMSPGGAMIEGPVLPETGAIFQLVRGSLIVHGLVIWSADGRCGLQFSGSVDVAQWQGAPTNSQQQRVDDIVRLVKAGAVPLPVPALGAAATAAEPAQAGEELPQDLKRVADLLVQLGDELAADDDVILAHGTALQNLDIAAQVVLAVIERLTGGEGRAESGAKLEGLRRSADQALQRRL